MSKFYVSEIFESIQGEGNFTGVRALFIRFHFCNLTCQWCDTKYTWWEKSGPYKDLSISELKSAISESSAHHIIFTGGEPTLYPLDELVIPGKKFHVETNGTLLPNELVNVILHDGTALSRLAMNTDVVKDFNWVVSPKLSNSRQMAPVSESEQKRTIRFWNEKQWGIFKFVIKSETDLNETSNFIESHKIEKQFVYIAIEGQSLQSQLKPELVDAIIKLGYNFSPRLHVMLWGAKRAK